MPKPKDITPKNVVMVPARDKIELPRDGDLAEVQGGWSFGGGLASASTARGRVNVQPIIFGGDGSDGPLDIPYDTRTLDLGGAVVFERNYSDIRIVGTGQLAFSNPHAGGTIVILRSRGNVTITSSANPAIDGRNLGSTAGTGGAADAGGTSATTPNSLFFGGDVTGKLGNAGAAGAGGSGGAAGAIFSSADSYASPNLSRAITLVPGVGGGGGGGGDTGTAGGSTGGAGGNGGRGGGAVYIECAGTFFFTSTVSIAGTVGSAGAVGASDGNGGGGGGGGGGGAGGMFLILYNILLQNTGTITRTGGAAGNGGNGGNGGNADNGGGAGGGGGSGGGARQGAGGAAGNGGVRHGPAGSGGGIGGTGGAGGTTGNGSAGTNGQGDVSGNRASGGGGGGGGGGAAGYGAVIQNLFI